MRDSSDPASQERNSEERIAVSSPLSSRVPAINLPKGGGAIRGVGEKFDANPVTGTGSWTVPIAVSPGRAGFTPGVTLTYDSGAGNGPFGLGWTLALPAITRKTDKGLPRYEDALESDEFVLSGAEDLVPFLIFENGRWERETLPPRTLGGQTYRIQRYRPRIEGLFAQIERWTNDSDRTDCFWRSIDRVNVTTWYGRTAESRIADPADPERVFSWLICESSDGKGNAIAYGYRAEDSTAVDLAQAHEANRTVQGRSPNRYPKRIRYGNRQPYFPGLAGDPLDAQLPPDWLFEIVFDYGEHDSDAPLPIENGAWPVRPDPFSTYRAGFELRAYRLCQRVLVFHHFAEEAEVRADCLVGSTDLTYRHEQTPNDPRNPVHTVLASVASCRYRRQGDGYQRHALPALEFDYSEAVIGTELQTIDFAGLDQPANIDGGADRWVDLDGEGISGVLTEHGGRWFYKPNDSPLTRTAHLGAAVAVASMPSGELSRAGSRQFVDLAGDGQLDLVELEGALSGYYERTTEQGWHPFRAFPHNPNIDWNDPNVRLIDLTGDGHADLLITEQDAFTWYPSMAEEGFGGAERVRVPADEERGPRLVFADGTETMFEADMSGDGLTDLVRIRNGEICYWPNLGYGRFGAKVTMDAAPVFDSPEQFDPARIRLADIDGTGVTDIVYLGHSHTRVWFNQSGNAWSAPQRLDGFPPADSATSVAAVDLLGNGTTCLVWSRSQPGAGRASVRYLELMAAGKPHLLVGVRNNLGAETRLRYAPSTFFYLHDKRAGRPWITRLPFPVHVVERVETFDHIGRNRFVTRFAYHHGYFDGEDREFRGFGMVEQFDTEEFAVLSDGGNGTPGHNIDASSHVPPALTRTWFHTGVHVGRHHVSDFFAGTVDENDLGEYYREPGLTDAQARARLLDDTVLPAGLTADEEREACRALRGAMLRQEVYALDATTRELHPFTVVEQNFSIRPIQPMADNRHAVFFTHDREVITYHYERNPADPRVNHALTLEADAFGNALKSASVAYGRRAPDLALDAEDRSRQTRTHVTYTEAACTNHLEQADAWRTPLPSETRTYELTGYVPSGAAGRFVATDFVQPEADGRTAHIFDAEIAYEELPAGGRVRRLIESVRLLYRPDDFGGSQNDSTALLPLGTLESLALPGETYQLAFTPAHLNRVFEDRVTDAVLLDEGRYVRIAGDGTWWIPSGRVFLSPDEADDPATELAFARQHFFVPRRFRNAFGATAIVEHDAHNLLAVRTTDAIGNSMTAQNDYRLLAPAVVVDANGNRAAAAFDVLGMVAGAAFIAMGDSVDGFESELTQAQMDAFFADPRGTIAADLLGNATTRTIYDETRFLRQGEPPCAATLTRETHAGDLSDGERTAIQVSLAYSDGFGRIIQTKAQAEPGPVQDGGASVARRWTTSGWTIFNNKGNPVRQHEPFFSADHAFEFAAIAGVSATLFYDPIGRCVATLHPDHTWEKVVFNPWRQESYDRNDTVLADPAGDSDVGDFIRRLPDGDYLPTWHALRTDPAHAAEALARWPDPARRQDEAAAANRAAAHADTPAVVHFDSLGRPFLGVADNGSEGRHHTRTNYDIESQVLRIIDARGNVVITHEIERDGQPSVVGYDVAGRQFYERSPDAGERRVLADIEGRPIRRWDGRGHVLRFEYDAVRRATHAFVMPEGEAELLAERTVYGENHPDAASLNLRGSVYQTYDGGGVTTNRRFDAKGNLRESSRHLAREYRSAADWSALANLTTVTDIETAAAALLEAETFITRTRYDALNRAVERTAPDSSVALTTFNEASLLERIAVRLHGADDATPVIAAIDYNARGQRTRVAYATTDGTDVETTYSYDPETRRLVRSNSVRGRDGRVLQDLNYVCDPVGNVTSIRDHAQQTVFFANTRVEPHGDYVYDALYRLVEARGREHAAQNAGQRDAGDFTAIVGIPFPNSPEALQRYHEQYAYDSVGNILSMRHVGGDVERWTRRYRYAVDGNRLLATSEAGDGANAFSSSYSYDAHGNMTRMPHLPVLRWDVKDRLRASSTQVVNDGLPQMTFYVYDAAGQRVRKVTEAGENGARRHERLYLGGFEIYREFTPDGSAVTLERQTLHLAEAGQRITQIDTRTQGDDDGPVQSRRFVLSNHLGSAVLELDEHADVVFYEEHHPYGTLAYAATRSAAEVSLKRYRYAGKERDEETGLHYHGARYCAAWLGRWTSADPIGIADGGNRYQFTRSNPLTLVDPTGLASKLTELTNNLKSDIAGAVKTAKKHAVKAIKAGQKSVKKAISKAQKKGLAGVTAELFEVVTYGVKIVNKSQLGKNIQADHIIAQGKIRLMRTDYEGRLHYDPKKDPAVVADTGKATETDPAKPHTDKTYHVETADVKEIKRLERNGIGDIDTDIVEPSMRAARDAGYPEEAIARGIRGQLDNLFSSERLADTNAELRRIEANGGPPPKKGPSGGKAGLSKGNVVAALAVGGFAALGIAVRGGSAEDAAIAAHDTVNPLAETTKAYVGEGDIWQGAKDDVWNLTVGAGVEHAKFSAKLGVSMMGGFPLVVGNEVSNFVSGKNFWEHF